MRFSIIVSSKAYWCSLNPFRANVPLYLNGSQSFVVFGAEYWNAVKYRVKLVQNELTHQAVACLKLTIETLEQGVKYVHS